VEAGRPHLYIVTRYVLDLVVRGVRRGWPGGAAAPAVQGGPRPCRSPRPGSWAAPLSLDPSYDPLGAARRRRPPSFPQASSAAAIMSSVTGIVLDVVLDRVCGEFGGCRPGGA
jgi:hypothetical protein